MTGGGEKIGKKRATKTARRRITPEQAQQARDAYKRLGSWDAVARDLGLQSRGGARYRAGGDAPRWRYEAGDPRPECVRSGCVKGARFGAAGCGRCERIAARKGVKVADLPAIARREIYGRRITPEVIAEARAAYAQHGTHARAAAALGVSVLTLRNRIKRGGPMARPERPDAASLPRCAREGCSRSSRPRSLYCAACVECARRRGASVADLPPIAPQAPPQTRRAAEIRASAAEVGGLAELGRRMGMSRERVRQLANETPRLPIGRPRKIVEKPLDIVGESG